MLNGGCKVWDRSVTKKKGFIYTKISIVVLSVVTKNRKQSRYLPIEDWLNKLWYVNHYAVIIMNKEKYGKTSIN